MMTSLLTESRMISSLKTCFKCGAEKDIDEFYRHPRMGDGRLGKCKQCTKKDVQQNYRARHEQYRAYELTRPNRAERIRECSKLHRARNPEKNHARQLVANAIRGHKLFRMPCEVCGDTQSEAHHDDYKQPFFIKWLCQFHHRAEHGRNVLTEKLQPSK
jgi:hypothetical protein